MNLPTSTLIMGPLRAQHPTELAIHTEPRTSAHPVLHQGEHINRIMEFLANDKRALCRAVVVCKKWEWAGTHLLWQDAKPREIAQHVSRHTQQDFYAAFVRSLRFEHSEIIFGSWNLGHVTFGGLEDLQLHEEHLEQGGPNVMLALITPALKSLRIVCDGGSLFRAPGSDAAWLAKLQQVAPQLSKLTFDFDICVTPEQFEGFFRSMPKLTHLMLSPDNSDLLTDDGLASIFANRHLEDLTLLCPITPAAMDVIEAAVTKPLDKLHTLNLTFEHGSGRAASRLIDLMPNVKYFDIAFREPWGFWDHTADAVVFPALGSLRNLIKLQIELEPEFILQDLDLIALSSLKKLKTLQFHLADWKDIFTFPGLLRHIGPSSIAAGGHAYLEMLLGMSSLEFFRVVLPGVISATPEVFKRYQILCREKGWDTRRSMPVVARQNV